MSNKETLQSYNSQLTDNNTSLDGILEIINNLPEYEDNSEPIPVYLYNFNKNPFTSGTFNFLTGGEGDGLLAIMQDAYDKGLELFIIKIIPTHTNAKDVGIIDIAIKIADGAMSLVDNSQNITVGSGTDIDLITVKKTLYTSITENVVSANSNGYVLTISGFNTKYSLSFSETDETITGTKSFSTLPECSVAPTANYHLVNKKYIDDVISTMDTSGSAPMGSPIFNIKFGYFTDSATQILSINSTGMSEFAEMYEYCLQNNITHATIYGTIQNDDDYKGYASIDITSNPSNRYINLYFYADTTTGHKGFFYSFALTRNSETGAYTITSSANSPYRFIRRYVRSDGATNVTALTRYEILPKSSVVPTDDEQFTNKAYVDATITAAITATLEAEY